MKRSILIIARLKSTRLPYKVIKKIEGKMMIEHMIDRLKLSKLSEKIIICTSKLEQDDALVDVAIKNNIDYFRGSAEDVLIRLRDAAIKFNVDTVINCTADNPFVDPICIDDLIEYHEREKNDFSKIDGLPFAVFSYALSQDALKKVCDIKQNTDTEVWHGYFMNTDIFKWSSMKIINQKIRWPELRLTVDTPADFQMISEIFKHLYKENSVFSLEKIISLCKNNKYIVDINKDTVQKKGPSLKLKNSTEVFDA